jgi:hypothetical protein
MLHIPNGFNFQVGRVRATLLQRRSYYKPNDGVLPRRDSRRTLAKTRRDLNSPNNSTTSNILIPPFVSPGELRILLGIEYKSALSLCQVKLYQQKYYWSDLEGRWFETSNKRKVLVPFSAVASGIRMFGLSPIQVDPEPTVPLLPERGRIPSIAVIGDASDLPFGETMRNPMSAANPSFDMSRMTFLPKPVSQTMMGRLITNADVVVFVGNSTDEFTARDFASRASVPIIQLEANASAKCIIGAVSASLVDQGQSCQVEECMVDPLAVKYKKEQKRTDILVDADKPPVASAVVLDVSKSVETGKTGTVLVRRGRLLVGQYFVAGSGFGRITNIWNLKGERMETASPGMLVKVGKLVKDTGDFAPDDFLHVFPKERAWRLAFHRERIEWLNSFQTEGKRIPVVFEMDSGMENRKNFAENVDEFSKRAEQVVGTDNFFPEPVDYKKIMQDKIEEKKRLASLLSREQGSILVEPEQSEESVSSADKLAKNESDRVSLRWARREEARRRERTEREQMMLQEKSELQRIRGIVHNNVDTDETTTSEPLPVSQPVFPLIIKTESVSQFDAILDKLEEMEETHQVKLPVVHGGIGPVTPNDLVHAEIESKYSPCPVYAVGTSVSPEAGSGQAGHDTSIQEFETIADVISAIRGRIIRFRRLNTQNRCRRSLEHTPQTRT